MCWLGDWIRLIHPMHWFQSLLRSSRRVKPQISHGFLAPFEGFPDASPGALQVWKNVGIQVIMGLSTGIPMATWREAALLAVRQRSLCWRPFGNKVVCSNPGEELRLLAEVCQATP